MTLPTVGIHPGVAFAEYLAWDAVNFSILKHFERSAAHAREAMLHPEPQTEAMALGQAVHVAVLEPERFEATYIEALRADRRTKAGKQAWAEFEAAAGAREVLPWDTFELCLALRDAAWKHPLARQYLGGSGHNELSALWSSLDGVVCKGRIDRLVQGPQGPAVVDLKTCRDASPQAFAKEVANYDYHAQMAHYLNGLNVLAPAGRSGVWLAIEKTRPHAIALYEVDVEMLGQGRALLSGWLHRYVEAKRTDLWPGYPLEVGSLVLPLWKSNQGVEW